MSPQFVAAIVGLFGGCVAGYISARLAWRLEREKWRRNREDVLTSDLRQGIQQLILALSSAAHSMCWLTWLAASDPAKMTMARIEAYDEEAHKTLPQILGYHALVSSLRPQVYQRFSDYIDKVFLTDGQLGNATLKYIAGVPATCADIAAMYGPAQALERELKDLVRSLLANVTRLSEAELQAAR